jgi:hypothetical protein
VWYTGPILFRLTAILGLAAMLPAEPAAADGVRTCYPDARVLRPLIEPHGCLGTGGSVSDDELASAQLSYGLFDRVDAGARIGPVRGRYGGWLGVALVDGSRPNALAFRVAAGFPDDPAVWTGLSYRGRVSDQLAFRLPARQLVVSRIAGETEVELALPVAFGLQPTGKLYLESMLWPVAYRFEAGELDLAIRDQLVTRNVAWYTFGQIEVGAAADLDFLDLGGDRRLWALARWRARWN